MSVSDARRVCFVDSNVWLYALIATAGPGAKRRRAADIAGARGNIVGTQVINEVCSVLLRKCNFTEQEIAAIVRAFHQRCKVVEVGQAVQLEASNLRSQYGFSFWDSLVVAAASLSGAEVLLSEDMQEGLRVGNLEIANPFRD
jgi:predicted nucleic acid-binding protein